MVHTGARSCRNYIGGQFHDSGSASITADNPSTGQVLCHVPLSTAEDAKQAVSAARAAYEDGPWRRTSPAARAQTLIALADALESRFDELEADLVADTGCTARVTAMLQVGGALAHLRDFVEMVGLLEYPQAFPIADLNGFGQSEIHREPYGVVAAFTPYNFPLLVLIWKIAPALLAGNTAVIKPSPLTPLAAQAFAEACEAVQLPPGVINVVHGDAVAGQALAKDPGVDLITFTGSTAVGRALMEAGAATAKPVLLEMGGKSPSILLEDADVELATRGTLFACMLNSGQVCAGTTRMLVPRRLYADVCDLLKQRASAMKVGPAEDDETDVGPVISAVHRDRILAHISSARDQGAAVLVGGASPTDLGDGYYVQPTVLAEVDEQMAVAQQEIFGPVLSVLPYDTVADAVRIANGTPYGLAASVWSHDLAQARALAHRIDSGTVWINDFGVADVRRTPFGGRKQSGVGAEFGVEGLLAYTQPKTIYTALDTNVDNRGYSVVALEWD
ncbi:aldehyde dehydrogenase family protein [Mycobacterium arosiense]|uniref:Aldehyde dehydrogenase n=1 Tax=Mycobacterium arosiense ATCC BAA-1401 = DSM 45069 TaxID=1265311 RepID=A0A1W9ZC44_MYCAI|nr:aldehyde dehydrogenase family protein [Mycobacterium arosiense]ORA11660.1 aldehyde dehydrogenase [Mycobacterium arosiense ATCC BAA-1401 = DSM 45069]